MKISGEFSLSVFWSLSLALSLLFLTSGCSQESRASGPEGTEYVIFIDFSRSVGGESQELIKKDLLDHVVPTLSAGDRILIAPITDQTLTKFHPIVDVTFPPWPAFNGWSKNRLQYQAQLDDVNREIPILREKTYKMVEGIFSKKRASSQTDIFSSMILAEKLFHGIPRRKVLIIMSDMIEDYPPYRFDRVSWTDEETGKLLGELNGKGIIPDLSDVCVYIAGPSARTPDMAGNIGAFWQAYFKQAKADFHPSRYAHVLLHWPPDRGCFRK